MGFPFLTDVVGAVGRIGRQGPEGLRDGALVDATGALWDGTTPLTRLTGYLPREGVPTGRTLYVNGMGVPFPKGLLQAQEVADATGREVILLYNQSRGFLHDLANVVGDKLGVADERVLQALTHVLYRQATGAEPVVRVLAMSHGGLIAACAVDRVRVGLLAEGHSAGEVERMLGRLEIETFGAASQSYPSGPQYRHLAHRLDPVPVVAGIGTRGSPLVSPGKGARVDSFVDAGAKDPRNWLNPLWGHHLPVYLRNYTPWAL